MNHSRTWALHRSLLEPHYVLSVPLHSRLLLILLIALCEVIVRITLHLCSSWGLIHHQLWGHLLLGLIFGCHGHSLISELINHLSRGGCCLRRVGCLLDGSITHERLGAKFTRALLLASRSNWGSNLSLITSILFRSGSWNASSNRNARNLRKVDRRRTIIILKLSLRHLSLRNLNSTIQFRYSSTPFWRRY
jgi:hypothetical protein